MKTNICKLSNDKSTLDSIFTEIEKSASYNHLTKKQLLRLRLLAEELVGMLPELLEVGSGEFWVENSDGDFELHVTIKAEKMSYFDKENILAVSKSGKNAAAKGIMNKIKIIAEDMLHGYVETSKSGMITSEYYEPYGAIDNSMNSYYGWSSAWSLNNYRECICHNNSNSESNNSNSESWDELEKSIIANLADDVIVGVIGKKVDIIIKKSFDN